MFDCYQVFDLSHLRESDITGESSRGNRARTRGGGSFPRRGDRGRGAKSKRGVSGSWNVEPKIEASSAAKVAEISNLGKRASDYFDEGLINKRTRF